MSDSEINVDRTLALAAAVCDESASRNEFDELDAVLLADPASRRRYLKYCRLHVSLEMEMHARLALRAMQERNDLDSAVPAPWESDALAAAVPSGKAEPIPAPIVTFPSPPVHNAFGYFSSGWPVAYLVATVIFGIGLSIGALTHVSPPEQIASQNLPSPFGRGAGGEGGTRTGSHLPLVVGQITGAVDCTWAGIAADSRDVSLGRKYELASGLVEITYNTGAKIILQGPATYVAESNGGYLSVGKLTGKLETKTQDPSPKTQDPFAIRTPTAIVTDLGTEFGVEVSQEGVTESHVFRGTVAVSLTPVSEVGKKGGRTVVLRENQSVRVETPTAAGAARFTALSTDAKPDRFVRNLPPPEKASPLHVLAHFRLGEDDPGAAAGLPVIEKPRNRVSRYGLESYGAPSYSSEAAPGSRLAVNFSGDQYLFTPYLCWPPGDNFILEAWARPNRTTGPIMHIVYSGRGLAGNGYGFAIIEGQWCCMRGGIPEHYYALASVPCELHKWTHVALVREQGKLQFWINGRLAKDFGDQSDIHLSSGSLSIGGAPPELSPPPNAFDGQIDEVRLSEFRGPFDPKMLLFQNVAGTLRAPSAGSAVNVENASGTRSVPATSHEERRK